jgi:predicted MPP superfamily phosphohydrolase
MFGSVLTIIGSLLHLYVFWRASSVPLLRRRLRPRAMAAIGLVMWTSFVLGRFIGHGEAGTAASVLELLSMTWLVSLFLASICLMIMELITGFGFLLSRHAPALRGWALVAGVGLSVLAAVQGLRPPVVQSYEVQLAGLPPELDGTVLVAMSDLHLGSVLGERWLADRVSQVQGLRPDLVVLLGDVFEGHGPPHDQLVAGLDRLSAPLGVWAVPGNHETYGSRERASPATRPSSIQMLHNRWAEVRPGLILAGVEDLTAAGRTGQSNDLVARALADRPPGATILLSHTPWQTDAAAEGGAALMLCGHTHGGQIWPLGYLVRTRYPLVDGRYGVKGMSVVVCRGTGTWGPRMRLWAPGEILRITLRGKPSEAASYRSSPMHSLPGRLEASTIRSTVVPRSGWQGR